MTTTPDTAPDAHDIAARELYAQTIDAVGPVNFPGDAPYIERIAAALRRAADDATRAERERIEGKEYAVTFVGHKDQTPIMARGLCVENAVIRAAEIVSGVWGDSLWDMSGNAAIVDGERYEITADESVSLYATHNPELRARGTGGA
jgi:hypothetical protein